MLQHTATHCNTLLNWLAQFMGCVHFTATHCNTPQHTATHCNTLQRTMRASPIQLLASCPMNALPLLMRYAHLPATYCNTLRHAATRCNMLQHVATQATHWHALCANCPSSNHSAMTVFFECRLCVCMYLRVDSATHCNPLQHAATHCNILQHTGAHCARIAHSFKPFSCDCPF